jgi:pimeloyl-ACP methyl ester carboxylesterase
LSDDLRHRFVQANGLRFHVAECGEGDRLALCLHGFPEHWLSWRHQLPLLARLGYRAWAPDLRGYGESDRPLRVSDYAIETLMADVAGLVDAASPRELVILGHDWGAIVAWYFAMRKLRPLDRLVAMNGPHVGAYERALGARQLARSWYVLLFQLPWLPERLLGAGRARAVGRLHRRTAVHPERFPDDVIEAYRVAAARPGALTAMLNYYRALGRGGGARRQRALGYPTLELPTLVIWGERDLALTREVALRTRELASNLELRLLPDASHWVQQDVPETVNAILEEWLG